MNENIICFATYNDLTNAYLVKNILEKNGIFSFIENENITAANPLLSNAVGGIRLMINENDLETALSLINENRPLEIIENDETEGEKEVYKNNNENNEEIICPECISSNTWKETVGFIFSETKFHCYDCGHIWQ